MTRLATRRAVPAGWLERVFSRDAQTNLLHHNPRTGVDFGAGLFIFGNTDAIAETKPIHKPPWITGR
jgi:hypothetical protein